jgi:hypothetical protein
MTVRELLAHLQSLPESRLDWDVAVDVSWGPGAGERTDLLWRGVRDPAECEVVVACNIPLPVEEE